MGREKTVIATGGYMFQAVFPGTIQSLSAADSAATLSSAFGANTNLVRVASDHYAWVAIGDSTASAVADSTSAFPVYANGVEYFGVDPGQYASVLSDTSAESGVVNLMEASVRSVPT